MAEARTYRFRSRPEAVSAARQALAGFDAFLDAGAFYDASLCVSELVTNAVLHADIGAEAELRLDVELADDGRLRVEVTDTGPGFSPPTLSESDDTGWGLFLVDRLSDRWGVDSGEGTCVWFEMSLAGASRARRPTHGLAARAHWVRAPTRWEQDRRHVRRLPPRPSRLRPDGDR